MTILVDGDERNKRPLCVFYACCISFIIIVDLKFKKEKHV